MTTAAWVTMALVCTYVWGGLLLLVRIALRNERSKNAAPPGPWEP